jgi:Uma2 family endonuclease
MAAMNSLHASRIRYFDEWFHARLGGRALASIQLPVRLGETSQPEPDFALLVPREDLYEAAHPGQGDVLLIIEVADTSPAYDRRKLALYAAASIPEVWILDLRGKRALVHRDPESDQYRQIETVTRDGAPAPLAFPDLVLPMSEIFRR